MLVGAFFVVVCVAVFSSLIFHIIAAGHPLLHTKALVSVEGGGDAVFWCRGRVPPPPLTFVSLRYSAFYVMPYTWSAC